MHTVLFLDFLPDDLSTIVILAIVLFIVAILWSTRVNRSRKSRKDRSFKDRYYEKRKEKD